VPGFPVAGFAACARLRRRSVISAFGEMKQMSKRRTFIGVLLLVVLFGLGGTIGRENVEADDGTGKWSRISSRFVLPWEPSVPASARPEADQYFAVRVTRWYCYGLGFKLTEHYSRER